jgi:hypothetical protein
MEGIEEIERLKAEEERGKQKREKIKCKRYSTRLFSEISRKNQNRRETKMLRFSTRNIQNKRIGRNREIEEIE